MWAYLGFPHYTPDCLGSQSYTSSFVRYSMMSFLDRFQTLASQSTARELTQCGIPWRNIDVIEPGCADPDIPPTSLAGRSDATIGCVSRLVKYKGLHLAFRALSKVITEFPDVKLLIAGSGPYQPELSKIAESLGISKNIQFLGRISEQSKFKLFGQSRLA